MKQLLGAFNSLKQGHQNSKANLPVPTHELDHCPARCMHCHQEMHSFADLDGNKRLWMNYGRESSAYGWGTAAAGTGPWNSVANGSWAPFPYPAGGAWILRWGPAQTLVPAGPPSGNDLFLPWSLLGLHSSEPSTFSPSFCCICLKPVDTESSRQDQLLFPRCSLWSDPALLILVMGPWQVF